jgi:hypothetical protein
MTRKRRRKRKSRRKMKRKIHEEEEEIRRKTNDKEMRFCITFIFYHSLYMTHLLS